jgi:flagellar hook-associated protein 3 FlgL
MTFISTLGQQQDQSARLGSLQLQLSLLQTQVATGKKTSLMKGLGTDVVLTNRARADFQKIDSYLQNIDRAELRMKQMEQGLKTIQTQVNAAIDSITNQTQKGEVELTIIRRLAENSYNFILDALNMKDGDAYIFSGSDTSTKPIEDVGSLDAYFGALNAEWAAGTLTITPPNTTIAEEYIARMNSAPTVTQGFSPSLSNAKQVYVRADDTVELNYTVLADSQPFKDIISNISALKNIADLDVAPGADEAEQEDNFFAVFNNIASKLTVAVDNLDLERFKLATTLVNTNTIKKNLTLEKNALLNTVSDIENIDLNEVALKVTSLQTQLEASYQVTAIVSQLNLAAFLR